MSRLIIARLEIAWNGADYVDESAYLFSVQGDIRYAAPLSSLVAGAGTTDQMTIVLDNSAGRFSPLNTSSAIAGSIGNGGMYMRPVRLDISINGGSNYFRVFTGVLKLPGAQSPTWQETSTVTLDARSRDELLLNRRWSSSMANLKQNIDTPYTEAQLMSAWLTNSGNGFSANDLTLDAGMTQIPFAWMDDESLLEEMWLMASACGGRFYAQAHDGDFRYENMAAWQTSSRSTTSQATLTPATWQRLEFRYEDADLYNEVTVEASPRAVGGVDVVWENESIVIVQPGQTETVTARFDAPVYSVTGLEYKARTAGGTDTASSIAVTPAYYAQRAELSIANSGTNAAYIVKLRILGRPIVGKPEQEATRNSADDGSNGAFFAGRINRNRRIGGNPYVQTMAQAQMLAQRLLDLSEYPRLAFSVSGVPGNPDRRLGDRITLDHSSIAGFISATTACYVTAYRWILDATGFVQDLELVQASNVFAHDGGYVRLGTDAPSANRRLFY